MPLLRIKPRQSSLSCCTHWALVWTLPKRNASAFAWNRCQIVPSGPSPDLCVPAQSHPVASGRDVLVCVGWAKVFKRVVRNRAFVQADRFKLPFINDCPTLRGGFIRKELEGSPSKRGNHRNCVNMKLSFIMSEITKRSYYLCSFI
jgi:hypothetical protein